MSDTYAYEIRLSIGRKLSKDEPIRFLEKVFAKIRALVFDFQYQWVLHTQRYYDHIHLLLYTPLPLTKAHITDIYHSHYPSKQEGTWHGNLVHMAKMPYPKGFIKYLTTGTWKHDRFHSPWKWSERRNVWSRSKSAS